MGTKVNEGQMERINVWDMCVCVRVTGGLFQCVCVCGHMLEAVLIQRHENKWEHAYTVHLPWQSCYTIPARRPDGIKTTASCGWLSLNLPFCCSASRRPRRRESIIRATCFSHRERPSDFCFPFLWHLNASRRWCPAERGVTVVSAWQLYGGTLLTLSQAESFPEVHWVATRSHVGLCGTSSGWGKMGAAQRAAEKQEAHSTGVKWRLGSASPNDTLQSLFWPRFYKVLQQNKVPCSRLLASGNRCCGLVSRQAGGPRSFILQYVPFRSICFHLYTCWPVIPYLTCTRCDWSSFSR